MSNKQTTITDRAKDPTTLELFQAAEEGDIGKIRKLVASGVDVNEYMDAYLGKSALSIAIEKENAPLVQYLIQANAIVNQFFGFKSYLQMAVDSGNVRITELLLNAGANPNEAGLNDPPLFSAILQGSVKLVQVLCRANANPFQKGRSGITAAEIPASAKIREALQECAGVPESSSLTVKKIQKQIQQSISSRNTFVIQSQKTGQCYSDAFQHVLYFADGIGKFFIERAIERSGELKTEGDLPLRQANLIKKIQTPFDAANLYVDFTGIRFLDMFRKPLLLPSPSATQKLPVRRKSIVSSISEQPLGIVCSQSLSVYEIVRSIFSNKAIHHANSENKRVSTLENIPKNLNVEGYGFVYESAAFELWDTMLDLIPKEVGKARIFGQTMGTHMFTKMYYDSNKDKYRVPTKFVVGLLIVVFPESLLRSDARVGHAISMVKVFGKWYVCDDNVGLALPVVDDFEVEELSNSRFIIDFKDHQLNYGIYSPWKLRKWFAENPESKQAPEGTAIRVLATVQTKNKQEKKTLFEPEFGYGGHGDYSISRKYITWQPVVKANNTTQKKKDNNKNKTNKNKRLRELALKYKLIKENEE